MENDLWIHFKFHLTMVSVFGWSVTHGIKTSSHLCKVKLHSTLSWVFSRKHFGFCRPTNFTKCDKHLCVPVEMSSSQTSSFELKATKWRAVVRLPVFANKSAPYCKSISQSERSPPPLAPWKGVNFAELAQFTSVLESFRRRAAISLYPRREAKSRGVSFSSSGIEGSAPFWSRILTTSVQLFLENKLRC